MVLALNNFKEIMTVVLDNIANNFGKDRLSVLEILSYKNKAMETILIQLCGSDDNFDMFVRILETLKDSKAKLELLNDENVIGKSCFNYASPEIMQYITLLQ